MLIQYSKEEFAERLKKAMEAKDFTSYQLSVASGVRSKVLYNYRTGKIRPTYETAHKLEKALDLPEGYLADIIHTELEGKPTKPTESKELSEREKVEKRYWELCPNNNFFNYEEMLCGRGVHTRDHSEARFVSKARGKDDKPLFIALIEDKENNCEISELYNEQGKAISGNTDNDLFFFEVVRVLYRVVTEFNARTEDEQRKFGDITLKTPSDTLFPTRERAIGEMRKLREKNPNRAFSARIIAENITVDSIKCVSTESLQNLIRAAEGK